MREFDAPFTVYVASDFAQSTGNLWWVALETVIAKASLVEADIDGRTARIDTSTLSAKHAAFERLHDWLRALPGRDDLAREIGKLCARYGVDRSRDLPRALHVLGRTETVRRRAAGRYRRAYHYPLQSCPAVRRDRKPGDGDEPRTDRKRHAAPALHLAYPYGDRLAAGPREFALAKAAGFKTAVTTRPGMIFPESAEYPDRAAAGFAQRQLPGRTDPAGAHLRRRYRDVERLSARRRGVTLRLP